MSKFLIFDTTDGEHYYGDTVEEALAAASSSITDFSVYNWAMHEVVSTYKIVAGFTAEEVSKDE
ncbi:MAG: hypothetical protein QNJ97_17995 [Myxococcota bacterium]|nr:hypothetical protein [Myxococcota bacterium]